MTKVRLKCGFVLNLGQEIKPYLTSEKNLSCKMPDPRVIISQFSTSNLKCKYPDVGTC